jgi:hypothetical protein
MVVFCSLQCIRHDASPKEEAAPDGWLGVAGGTMGNKGPLPGPALLTRRSYKGSRREIRAPKPVLIPGSAARSREGFPGNSGRDLPTTPRATAARGQLYRNHGVPIKGWGACPETGMSTMLGKIIIGLTAVTVVMVVPTMSASAQQTPAQQKKVTVNIPKQVCEIVTVGTQNWGQQTVQVCGPPGGPRGQATAMSPKLKYRQAKPQ